MAPLQSSPDLLPHIRVVVSIIVGLCITTLLNGFARFVQHPRRAKVSLLHLGWAASHPLLGVGVPPLPRPAMDLPHLLLRPPLRNPLLLPLHPSLSLRPPRLLRLRGLLPLSPQMVLRSSHRHFRCRHHRHYAQRLGLRALLRNRISHPHRGIPDHLLHWDVRPQPPHPVHTPRHLSALSNRFHPPPLQHGVTPPSGGPHSGHPAAKQ